MARQDNNSNPYTRDKQSIQKQVPMPIKKARVINAKGHPDRDGFHTVRIVVYGDAAPYDAPVLTPIMGSVWVPEQGTDVAVMFSDADKPWVIGSWYALDRIEDGEIDLPDYKPGDLRLGNSTGAHVTIKSNGDVRISSSSSGDVYIDGVKQ